jgi:hypothetical protein
MENTGRQAAQAGIDVAIEHADRVAPEWRHLAYDALVAYARRHDTFTIEQLREHLNGKLADPPSLRAWGGIARKAQHAGIIAHGGFVEATATNVHANVVTLWRSRILGESA